MRIAIYSILIVVACACTQTTYITKADLNEGAFARDSSECRQQGGESAFYDCMRGKGYSVNTATKSRFKMTAGHSSL
ncbi:MAG TPA: hypothetical protein VI231_00060 [Candidatus Binatia bacterium]|jgi:hypothetical protein